MSETTGPTGQQRPALPAASGRAVAAWLWAALEGRRMRLAGVLVLFLSEAAAGLVFPW